MRLGYRKAKTQPIICNSERCLVQRQQFAIRMIPLLESDCFKSAPSHYVINVDESWLNNSRFVRRAWTPADAPATFTDKQIVPRISLLAALDTEGSCWFALTQATTDADVMTTFIMKLMQ